MGAGLANILGVEEEPGHRSARITTDCCRLHRLPLVAAGPTYCQDLAWSPCTFAVEQLVRL